MGTDEIMGTHGMMNFLPFVAAIFLGLVFSALAVLSVAFFFTSKPNKVSEAERSDADKDQLWQKLSVKNLVSDNEKRYLNGIKSLLKTEGKNYEIHAQVSLLQITSLNTINSRSDKFYLMNRYGKMAVDFVLCDENYKPVLGIEIDDQSHTKTERVKADEVKNKVFESINIPLVRLSSDIDPNNLSWEQLFNSRVINKVKV